MFLYEKQKSMIVNMDMVKDIFPGRDAGSVAVGFTGGITTKLAVYTTEAEAREAVAMLADRIAVNNRDIVVVPDMEEVRARLQSRPDPLRHHVAGKKTKGHGGS